MSVLRQEPSYLFPEDQVLRFVPGQEPQVGVVVSKVADDASDSDESESKVKLELGQVSVAFFPKGKECVVAEDELILLERSLLLGDIVKRLPSRGSDKSVVPMMGQVMEASVYCDLRVLGSHHVLLDVDSRRLELNFDPDVLRVVKDVEWIGSVEAFNHEVTLAFADESRATVPSSVLFDAFEDVRRRGNRHPDSYFAIPFHYPGQVLLGDIRALDRQHDFALVNAEVDKLLTKAEKVGSGGKKKRNAKSKKNRNAGNEAPEMPWNHVPSRLRPRRGQEAILVEATVVDVKLKDVDVLWWTYNPKPNTEKPKRFVAAEEFRKLRHFNYFPFQTVQVGDPGFLEYKEGDRNVSFNEWRKIIKEWKPEVQNEEEEESFMSANDTFDEGEEEDNNNQRDAKPKAGKKRKHSSRGGRLHSSSRARRLQSSSNRLLPPNLYATLEKGSRLPVEILRTSTRVSVEWQDGSFEKDLPSHTLFPERHCGDQDNFCKDFVERVESSSDEHEYGLVEKVDVEARICTVKWFTYDTEKGVPIYKETEDVPVYELRDHVDFSRLDPETTVYVGDVKRWVAKRVDGEWRLEKVDQNHQIKQNSEDELEIQVGEVMSTTSDGEIRVHWGNSIVLNCWPQHLLIMDSEAEANMMHDDDFEDIEEDDSDPEWETEEEEEVFNGDSYNSVEISQSLLQFADIIEHLAPAIGEHLDLSEVRETIGALDRLKELAPEDSNRLTNDVASLWRPIQTFIADWTQGVGGGSDVISNDFGALLQNLRDIRSHFLQLSSGTASQSEQSTESQTGEIGKRCDSQVCEGSEEALATEDRSSQTTVSSPASPVTTSSENTSTTAITASGEAGSFGMLSQCPVDVHIFGRSLRPSSLTSSFTKAVRGEMRRLQKSLPPGIHVKSFEDRLDLFSVMIEGATMTPYEHGIFFFDIRLHGDHPRSPPDCKYLSLCQGRLNPNLYEDGTVCVSLLGTWSGRNTENWTSESNLLQLLISLQSLILVPEPYYNEAGYESHRGTEKGLTNSRIYNEMVALKLVQSMTTVLGRVQPLNLFEKEVRAHFENHGQKLADKMRAFCGDEINKDLGYPLLPLSKGLKLSLEKALVNYEERLQEFLRTNRGQN